MSEDSKEWIEYQNMIQENRLSIHSNSKCWMI